ncbi:MAG: cation-translocating P-type ATPase [Marinovum sp.]|nr:cation-translocating P-type ATPase [Marinovum sp.]
MMEAVEKRTLALDGVNCASCIFKIEDRLRALHGVRFVRGNATTRRLRLSWDPRHQTQDTLVREIESIGYGAHVFEATPDVQDEPSLLPQLALAGFAIMNIMAFSISVWAGAVTDMGPGTMQYMHWASGFLTLPVVIFSGAVFYGPALKALSSRHMTMDTPIALAILVTFGASVVETLRGADHVYFDAVVSLIFLLLIGRVLDRALRRKSGDAAGNLRALLAVKAQRIDPDGTIQSIPAEDLSPGDRVLLATGMPIPADGVLESGPVWLDESAISGESDPRGAVKGDTIIAGSIMASGTATLLVTHVGEAAQLGQMSQLIEDVIAKKGRAQLMADRFSKSYVPLVFIGGLMGFLVWFLLLDASFGDALMIAVAVLVVTCPCAAGLATPAVASRAVNLLLRDGIMVKSGEALEHLGQIDHVYTDKTGTLSLPILKFPQELSALQLKKVAALASVSSHPLASAAIHSSLSSATIDAVEFPGQGVQSCDGARLGSADFVGLSPDDASLSPLWFRDVEGPAISFTVDEGAKTGLDHLISFVPTQKLTLISGDSKARVAKFANTHGIVDWLAEQSPVAKLDTLKGATKDGQTVLMLGDGINDAGALSAATVSMSFSEATQIAQSSADFVLLKPDLMLVVSAMKTARQARRLIHQNLWFSTLYNLLTVPLALVGYLSPMIAALLMSSSSILVLLNALRLRRHKCLSSST